MAKYFKSVKSYDDLKNQYKKLLKENHPDNGGDLEVMKEINVEYDALFTVWKNKKEVETGEEIKETADSTRSQFYTMFGWEGSNHDWNRSLKEVAQIVRTYVRVILQLKAYENALTERYNFIKTAPTKQKIKLYREKRWKDKVYYYISYMLFAML